MKKTAKGIIETSIIVALIAIFAKIIGFGRETIVAAYFGASSQTDAYFLALNMPALVFPAICGSLSTAFLSVYITTHTREGSEKADFFASSSLNLSIVLSLLLSFLALILSPIYVPLLAPGFDSETIKLAVNLTRITMAGFPLIMLQYMLTAILNSKKFFFGAQIAGIFYNTFIITITLLLGKSSGVVFLTYVTVTGLLVQVLTLIYFSRKKISYFSQINVKSPLTKKMILLSLPILAGNSIAQVSAIVDKILASKLGEGAVSSLSYANSLNSVVTSVFIVSLSTVLYPALTENASKNDYNGYLNNLRNNLLMLIMVIAPISVVTVIHAQDIISIVFYHGKFNEAAARYTADALTYYGLGYVFLAIREVLIRGFFAVGDSKSPMINGIISVLTSTLVSVILYRYIGIKGIAIGTSVAAVISSALLIINIKKKLSFIRYKDIIPTVIKIVLSAITTSIMLLLLSVLTSSLSAILRFSIAMIIGFCVYLIMLLLMKCKELLFSFTMIKERIHSLRLERK